MKTPALLFLSFLSALIFSQDSTGYSLKITKISKYPALESKAKVYKIMQDSYFRIRTKTGQIIKSTNDYSLTEDAIVFGKTDTLKLSDIESIAATYQTSKVERTWGTILIIYAPVAFIASLGLLISYTIKTTLGDDVPQEGIIGLIFFNSALSAIVIGSYLSKHRKTFYTNKWRIEIQEVKINN